MHEDETTITRRTALAVPVTLPLLPVSALATPADPAVGQRKNFLADVEQAVPAFYETVGQHLRAYQSPAPRVRDDRSDPDSVTRAVRCTPRLGRPIAG